ncbi:hydroxyethylthiazole kinase [Enterococcus sp. DIV0800]|uniref:hydroxyethylthiazole kinase n=1 Tax=unclassified Enterococcus TaxID=2608891 RepID=UPI003D2FA5C5
MKTVEISASMPLANAPLVHCITNEVTCETVANALLYVGAKPIMASDEREFAELFQQTDSLLLNIGHLSKTREKSLVGAAELAKELKKPTVVDLVGYGVSTVRNQVGRLLVAAEPTVVKGNISELRNFCGLPSQARGVDGSPLDQSEAALEELTLALQKLTVDYPRTIFLATGSQDLVVDQKNSWRLQNGVPELDRFTGTGDVVGALIAALLGSGVVGAAAVVSAVSYFNCCGEAAKNQRGLANFRQETLNQLTLLMETEWTKGVKGWQRSWI